MFRFNRVNVKPIKQISLLCFVCLIYKTDTLWITMVDVYLLFIRFWYYYVLLTTWCWTKIAIFVEWKQDLRAKAYVHLLYNVQSRDTAGHDFAKEDKISSGVLNCTLAEHNEPDTLVSDSAQKSIWEFLFWYFPPKSRAKIWWWKFRSLSEQYLSQFWGSKDQAQCPHEVSFSPIYA